MTHPADRPSPFQLDLLVGLLTEGAVDADHAAEGAYIWDYVSWPEGMASLQMRNFDRALDALVRKGLALQVGGESSWYLTDTGRTLAQQERDRRRARRVL